MPSTRSLARATATVLTGLALSTAAATVAAGTASASAPVSASAEAAGLCNVNQNTWVRVLPGFTGVLYTIPAGGGFRVDGSVPAYADGLWWWWGHGNGGAFGWVPDQNLTNCH
jgi:hypothetical protein